MIERHTTKRYILRWGSSGGKPQFHVGPWCLMNTRRKLSRWRRTSKHDKNSTNIKLSNPSWPAGPQTHLISTQAVVRPEKGRQRRRAGRSLAWWWASHGRRPAAGVTPPCAGASSVSSTTTTTSARSPRRCRAWRSGSLNLEFSRRVTLWCAFFTRKIQDTFQYTIREKECREG